MQQEGGRGRGRVQSGPGSAGTWREGRGKGRGEEDGRQGRREMEGKVREEREEPEQQLASRWPVQEGGASPPSLCA